MHRRVSDAQIVEASTIPKQTIFVCPQCHSSFLTSTGLEKHMQSHACDAAPADPESARASKMPRIDTVQAMLNRTPADIPKPPKTFLCPLCQTSIGRKGPAGYLRNAHQVDKPEFFSFRPNRDMMLGRLGCAHCMSCFTLETALPACHVPQWVKDLHFGPVAVMESTILTIAQPEEHLLEPTDRSSSEQSLTWCRPQIRSPHGLPLWIANPR